MQFTASCTGAILSSGAPNGAVRLALSRVFTIVYSDIFRRKALSFIETSQKDILFALDITFRIAGVSNPGI